MIKLEHFCSLLNAFVLVAASQPKLPAVSKFLMITMPAIKTYMVQIYVVPNSTPVRKIAKILI